MPPSSTGVTALPTFAALDTRAVLEGERRGASIQVSESYFRGQETAIDALETDGTLAKRQDIVSQSRRFYDQIQVEPESVTREALKDASAAYRRLLQQIPEVQYLKREFPETCFVIPEWARSPGRVNYGARIYFFREDAAPAPADVLRRNIDAVVRDELAAFERYQGTLHGYPECCIEYYSDYGRDEETGPELEAVETIAESIEDEAISEGVDRSTSIEDVTPGLFEIPQAYAFFAREFFPEPECERARRRGISIYDTLCEAHVDDLVRDHFRINAGWSYLMARATAPDTQGETRLSPGVLGWEHLLFYLPLAVTSETPRYRTD